MEFVEVEEKEMKLNLNSSSIVGLNFPKIMKFIGKLKGRDVMILLDNETTHNSIWKKLDMDLKIQATPI